MNKHEDDGLFENRPAQEAGDGQFSSGVELLSKALKAVFLTLAVLIIVMILFFLAFGGSFIVDTTTESVIVLRFGKYYDQYNEGWHWFMPYPVNKIVRIPTNIQTLRSVSFMPPNSARLRDPNSNSGGMAPDSLTPGKDGYLLTGGSAFRIDEKLENAKNAIEKKALLEEFERMSREKSILHSEWSMTYRISDPTQYFLNCVSRETSLYSGDIADGPDGERVSTNGAARMLKNILDDVVITVTAGLDIQKTYYEKTPYENAVKKALIERIREMKIGITVENLSLTLVSPPVSTLQAFQLQQLTSVMVKKAEQEAETYAVEQRNKAQSEAVVIKSNAEAYRKRIESEVIADTIYFKQILTEYRKNPEATLVSLYSGNLASAMTKVNDKFVLGITPGAKQEIRLKLNPEPTVKKDNDDTKKDSNK